MKKIQIVHGESPLALLAQCGGYYEQPPGGPLVGYAGRYGDGKQFVGRIYANFAKAERNGLVLRHFAEELVRKFPQITDPNIGFCAAPEGGKALAVALANITGAGYLFPEKRVTALKTESSREKSDLVWGRHEPEKDESWWIVEDVCNNFSTTKEMIALIESKGASVAGIICFLNRSLDVDDVYGSKILPVLSLVRKVIAEYRQDDPMVATDVKAHNVVWKPKNDWDKLANAMKQVK